MPAHYWPPFSRAFSGVLLSGFFGSLGANSPGFALREVPSSLLLCESVFPANSTLPSHQRPDNSEHHENLPRPAVPATNLLQCEAARTLHRRQPYSLRSNKARVEVKHL